MKHEQIKKNLQTFQEAAETVYHDSHYGREDTIAMMDGLYGACKNIAAEYEGSDDAEDFGLFLDAIIAAVRIRMLKGGIS